jgi:hypothetical protein
VQARYGSPGPGLPRSGPAPRCLPSDVLLFFLRLRSWPCGDAPLSLRRFFFLRGPMSKGLRVPDQRNPTHSCWRARLSQHMEQLPRLARRMRTF